jgi:hypothetical protein
MPLLVVWVAYLKRFVQDESHLLSRRLLFVVLDVKFLVPSQLELCISFCLESTSLVGRPCTSLFSSFTSMP